MSSYCGRRVLEISEPSATFNQEVAGSIPAALTSEIKLVRIEISKNRLSQQISQQSARLPCPPIMARLLRPDLWIGLSRSRGHLQVEFMPRFERLVELGFQCAAN
jgi:hypothetical protein